MQWTRRWRHRLQSYVNGAAPLICVVRPGNRNVYANAAEQRKHVLRDASRRGIRSWHSTGARMALLCSVGSINSGFGFPARCGPLGTWGMAHDSSAPRAYRRDPGLLGPMRAPETAAAITALVAVGGARDVCFDNPRHLR